MFFHRSNWSFVSLGDRQGRWRIQAVCKSNLNRKGCLRSWSLCLANRTSLRKYNFHQIHIKSFFWIWIMIRVRVTVSIWVGISVRVTVKEQVKLLQLTEYVIAPVRVASDRESFFFYEDKHTIYKFEEVSRSWELN